MQGGTPGISHAAGLPEIEAKWNDRIGYYGGHTCSGAVYSTGGTGAETNVVATNRPAEYGFKASLSNNIYGASTTVQPKSVESRYIIRF